jgi:hypothetical protein
MFTLSSLADEEPLRCAAATFSWNIHGQFCWVSSASRQTHDVPSLTNLLRSYTEQSGRLARDSSRPALIAMMLCCAAVAGLVLAACTPSPSQSVAQLGTTTTAPNATSVTTTNKYGAWLAYSRCVRAHGFPTYPDPKEIDGDVQVSGVPAGVNPDSATFTSAQGSCRHLEPNGGQSTGTEQQQVSSRLLRLSRCMRQRGITGFPDPTIVPPSNRGEFSDIMSNDGVWLAIPNSVDVHSPAFDRASLACDFGHGS